MVDYDNIQSLFSSLRVCHVKRYLLAKGWRLRATGNSDALCFQGPLHSGGSRYEVVLPASEGLRGYRDRLQRLVFNVSCIEDRQPIDVAREMMTVGTLPEPVDVTTVATHVRVRNEQRHPIRLQLESQGVVHVLESGDTVDILVQAPPGAAPEMIHRDDVILVSCRTGSVRLFRIGRG